MRSAVNSDLASLPIHDNHFCNDDIIGGKSVMAKPVQRGFLD
jgi:hypothetical protein